MKCFQIKCCWLVIQSGTFLRGHFFSSSFWSSLYLDRCTFKFMVKGIMEGPGFTSLAHVKYQIQVDKNPGTWIWISPNGSHGSSRRATSWTGRSILKAESRKGHALWSTNSWVVWFSCGILNLQPLPAERSKTFWPIYRQNVCKYMTLTSGKLFQPDKYNNQSINISPFINITLILKESFALR